MNGQVMNLYYEDVHSYILNLASKTFSKPLKNNFGHATWHVGS